MFKGEVIMPAQRFVSLSMDPFMEKLYDRPINGKYVLIQRLGKGGFGVVYLGNDQALALKLEHHSVDPSFLEEEARKYEAFQDAVGFPKVFWFGWHDDFRVMAFELLGPTLEDLLAYCGHRFSLKTTLLIVDQILVRLERLHFGGVIHRDIKPQNFLLGTGTNGSVIYVTDFGLADEYTISRVKAEEETPPRSHLVGTARFASIRGHQGQAQSPKDDLESLGYMMAFFARGRLPWQGLQAHGRGEKNRAVMEKKMATSVEQLCEELPEEFAQYMQEVKDIPSGVRPHYDELRHKFRRLAVREGVSAKYSTPTTRRKKNVIPEFDSLKVLTFHYTEDPAQSENERQRVQLAVLFLVHAFSAAPPWSTTNINMRRTRGPIAGR
ncbi:casein kinase I [Friedmanniomyces endolithicus]|nr:casein kinase I [Friedmanniomyces endolithicus]